MKIHSQLGISLCALLVKIDFSLFHLKVAAILLNFTREDCLYFLINFLIFFSLITFWSNKCVLLRTARRKIITSFPVVLASPFTTGHGKGRYEKGKVL